MTVQPITDVLGHPISEAEQKLLDSYRELEALAGRTDLPPCATMNVRQAMVMLWNACNDLNLVDDAPTDD